MAWSSFATGRNPGGHGVFDFLRRDPATYLPDLALCRHEQKNAFSPPKAVNLRKGTTIWEHLSASGVASTVLRCPCSYPPESIKGRVLSGMGVPDLRGGLGTATFFTSAQDERPGEAEQIVKVSPALDGSVTTALIGPRNPRDRSETRFEIAVTPLPDSNRARLRSSGSPRELVLEVGRWSDWLKVAFKVGMFGSAKGMVRFFLDRIG